ncbi:tetracycline resistance protein transposon [Ophiostoma piceae UAMH 11346]|uniref:Tetracycline resistance protein transposon n=1 Tax=Ophiostoma piceae (strain UAMH 11346) TaxID=1262450 RepID=S3C2L3_OPHP1|nr:tetracycline resistance protein transposon [Ophiostoma piceae UAMH 11346]
MASPKIAIVGAGPAGCTLARLLHRGGIDAVVYEGEAGPNYRSQGGTLDLHTATGLAAVKEAGLWDEFLKHARYDGEYMLVCDKHLNSFFSKGHAPTSETDLAGQRPEIDRSALRQMLSESLPSGMIQWGHHVKSVTTAGADDAGKKASITFADGTTAGGFDLVVGADGAWSKVRAALSDQQPLFSGMAIHEMHIPDAATNAPELTALVNRGSIFVQADGRKAAIQQMGDGSLHVSIATRRSDTPNVPLVRDSASGTRSDSWPATCGYDAYDLDAVKNACLTRPELISDFDPRLQDCVTKARGTTTPRSLYALPVGFQWPHQRGLTAIGDAAHLMTPFAGEGVNAALEDAQKLAAVIVAADTAFLDDAIAAAEQAMFQRAAKVGKLTDDLLQAWFYTPGAPESVVASVLATHVRYHTPVVMQPLATAAVHAYYFLYKKCLKKDLRL